MREGNILTVLLSTACKCNHSQKRLISYLWKWGKIVELPHFQDEENLGGFAVQGNAKLATIANTLFSNLGKFLSNKTHQHKHCRTKVKVPISDSIVCYPLDFQQENNVSGFPSWKSTLDFLWISHGFPYWETQVYWQ